jgi:dephospho-CoA kinase
MNFEYAIALTGGIATGKSTVASFLTMYGFKKVDADKIAHQLLDEYSEAISDMFGVEYIENNRVNRTKLGELIFSNKDKKVQLEQFLHPKIKDRIVLICDELDKLKSPYLVDIPLFFEKKNYDIKRCLLVYTPKDIQIQRLIKRENYTQKEAENRINSQINIDKKLELIKINPLGFVINNGKDLAFLQSECEKFKINILKTFSIS